MTITPERPVLSRSAYDAVIFDLDGVLTSTAELHAAAWRDTFNQFLQQRGGDSGVYYRPFDSDDYRRYVDGKPRYDGVRSFLASRGIDLPYGDPADPPGSATICGLGNRKNALFRRFLDEHGVRAFPAAVRLIHQLQAQGFALAVVSASRNASKVLGAAGIQALFDVQVDGVVADERGLPGKPAPDLFLEAARRLGSPPKRCVVVEDAVAGVQAGRSGQFALVVGVSARGQVKGLLEAGADTVVSGLHELGVGPVARGSAFERLDELSARLRHASPAVFLDYDGTLTPIVDRPEQAVLAPRMREVLDALAHTAPVAIVSGRDRRDVERLVGLDHVYYAGSHGFDIVGPAGTRIQYEQGREALPALEAAESRLEQRLGDVDGCLIERKRFSIAVHYRLVAPEEVPRIEAAVDAILAQHPDLRKTHGKKVFELRPDVDWDKGKAVQWVMDALGLRRSQVLPIYIGDDVTDEDAFRALSGQGIGIRVGDIEGETAADYRLADTDEVRDFLEQLSERVKGRHNE